MKKINLLFAAMAVMALTSCGNSDSKANAKADVDVTTEANVSATDAPQEVKVGVIDREDDPNFGPDSKVAVPTVLDFNAVWCIPCKKLSPAFEAASEKYAGKVEFYNVDIDKCKAIAKAFNIQGVPTVVFMAPGKDPQVYTSLNEFGVDAQTPADQMVDVIKANMDQKIEALLN